MKHKISFIGAGTMGRGMITNLVNSGYEVEFYNRTPKDIKGATYTPLEKLSGDVIFICVANDEAVKNCFDTIHLKKNLIVVDTGTTSLELTKNIKEKCEKNNAHFLDAPITGSKLGAESGNLIFMVGGEKNIFDSLHSEFEAMGKCSIFCGETPRGQKVKYALNLIQSNIFQGCMEGITLAIKSGVNLDSIMEVIDNSAARNGVTSFKMPYIKIRDFKPHFLLELMYKDLKFANEQIEKLNLDLPLSKNTIGIFSQAMDNGLAKDDFAAIIKLIEKKNNVVFK